MTEDTKVGIFVFLGALPLLLIAAWFGLNLREPEKAQPTAGFTCRQGFIVPEGSHFDVSVTDNGVACATSAAGQIICWEIQRCQ